MAPRPYRQYQDAAIDLMARIGDYCSYCERQIETNLAVEHIKPKSRHRRLRNLWNNFLLGCTNCNSSKGNRNVTLRDFFWPDSDNTGFTFLYTFGMITANPQMNEADRNRASSTLVLLGLDRDPGNPNRRRRPTKNDRRWQRRLEVWEMAQRALGRLNTNNSIEVRESIVEIATSRGMFSIWMKVFENDTDMRGRFIRAFPGTADECYDPETTAVVQVNGRQ